MKIIQEFIDENCNWPFWNWITQIIFFIITILFMVIGLNSNTGRLSLWYYFSLSTVVLLTGAANCIILKRSLRTSISLAHIVLNTYIIPGAMYAYGRTIGEAFLLCILYVIIVVAISPLITGAFAVTGGICFSAFLKAYFIGLGDHPYGNITLIVFAYIGLAILGYTWKILILKLYKKLISPEMAVDGEAFKEHEEKIKILEEDNQMLKSKIVDHIVEINKIVSSGQKNNE